MDRVFFLLITLSLNLNGLSQIYFDTIPVIKSAEVQWLKEFPMKEMKANKKKHGLGNLLMRIAGVNNTERIILNKPMSVYAKGPEDIWIVDQGNADLMWIEHDRVDIPRVFSKKKFDYQSLVSLCYLPERGILFTDSRLNKIFLLDKDHKSIVVLSESLILNQPTGIACYGPKSEIWVVETASHCITILDITGKKIRSFGNRGAGNGEFNFPTSIWIDKMGFVYVVDALNYRVQILDQQGNFIKSFGAAGNASGYFAMPKGVATDSYGNIYVADALFHIVQVFDRQGRFLISFGSQGRDPGQFWMPAGIFIDDQDNIYVADSYNSRIQLFKLQNIVKINEKIIN